MRLAALRLFRQKKLAGVLIASASQFILGHALRACYTVKQTPCRNDLILILRGQIVADFT
jgi:hypothetical protein